MASYIWILLEKSGLMLVRLITVIILARILEPHDFGLFSMVAIIVSLSNVLIDSGLSGAIIQKKNINKEYYHTAFSFNIVVALILSLTIFFSSDFIASFYNEPKLIDIVKVLALTIIIKSFATIHCAKLTKDLVFKNQAIIYIFSSLVSAIIGVFLALKGAGYWALVTIQIIESFLVSTLFFICSDYKPKIYFSKDKFIDLFSFGGRLMVSSLIFTIYQNSVNIVLGRKFGAVELGYYSQSQKINEMYLNTLTLIIDKAIFPKLSKLSDDLVAFKEMVYKVVPIVALLSFFIFSFVFVSSDWIILCLLGEGWDNSVDILRLLSLSAFGLTIESYSRCFIKSMGEVKVILKQELYKRVLGIILILISSYHGMYTVIYTLLLLSILNALVNSISVCKILKINIISYYRLLLFPIIFSLLGVFCSFYLFPDDFIKRTFAFLFIYILFSVFIFKNEIVKINDKKQARV
ncbi:lipopolysaccharide biosynthesis protein [Vibrio antiquarius]